MMFFTHLPSLGGQSRPRMRPASWAATVLLAGSLGAAWPVLAQTTTAPHRPTDPVHSKLPTLGEVQGISVTAERQLGDQIAQRIYQNPDYLDDPVLMEYLYALWHPLLSAARARGDVSAELSHRLAWELVISRDSRINAFALPGGYLGVNLGLIAATSSAAELAAVMAHELSHVSQRHIARMIEQQDRIAPWILGALVVGALAASSSPDVANAAISGSQALAAQTQLNFSRDMEREADRLGLGVLTDAGFEGQGFVELFNKLEQSSRLNDDGSFAYLRSHPLTSERMADMRARLPRSTNPAAATTPPVPNDLHSLMAARARVLAQTNPERWQAWLQNGQGPSARPAERYAAAYAALRLRHVDQALDLGQRLRPLVTPASRWVVDALLLEALLMGNTNSTRAKQLASLRDQALSSSSRPLVLLGAQAAIATAQAPQAASQLQTWVQQHPRDALAWQTLAQAYSAQGQTLRAIRAEAEAHLSTLDYAGALERLKAAQSLPAAQRNADPIELAIIDSRLRQAQTLLSQSQEPIRK